MVQQEASEHTGNTHPQKIIDICNGKGEFNLIFLCHSVVLCTKCDKWTRKERVARKVYDCVGRSGCILWMVTVLVLLVVLVGITQVGECIETWRFASVGVYNTVPTVVLCGTKLVRHWLRGSGGGGGGGGWGAPRKTDTPLYNCIHCIVEDCPNRVLHAFWDVSKQCKFVHSIQSL